MVGEEELRKKGRKVKGKEGIYVESKKDERDEQLGKKRLQRRNKYHI